MTIETTGGPAASAIWRLPRTIAGLVRFVRAVLASHRAEKEISGLSDHHLQDIGVERAQISELVEREVTRRQLLDAGWTGQREHRRR